MYKQNTNSNTHSFKKKKERWQMSNERELSQPEKENFLKNPTVMIILKEHNT